LKCVARQLSGKRRDIARVILNLTGLISEVLRSFGHV
jgi:hypothetical protein